MADVKINLEATHKEFLAAIQSTSKSVQDLLGQLNKMSDAHTKGGAAAKSHASDVDKATQATKAHSQATQQAATSQNSFGQSISAGVAKALLLVEALKTGAQAVSGFFQAAISNIDDFKKQTIGTAAAITNIRDETQSAGLTWSQVFQQNLKATTGTFLELERLAARYFASSIDLQLAYNAFAQRGIVIRKSELEQLAQLTDLILLLTQGQQSTIQVQEEIRSLINGTLRPTAQLGQLLKSYGKDIKEVGAEIRATQSLRPLEGVLRGAAEATKVIQGTFQAVSNGLEVALRQIGRIGGEQFFNQLVGTIERFTNFLNANREKISGFFAGIGSVVAKVVSSVEQFVEQLIQGNGAVTNAAGPFIRFAAVTEAVVLAIVDLVKVLATLIRDIPLVIDALVGGLNEIAPAADKAFSPTAAIVAGFKSVIGALLPGFGQLTDKSSGFHKALVIVSKDLEALGTSDPFKNIDKRIKEITATVAEAEANAAKLFKAGAGESIIPVAVGFKEDAESKAETKRLQATAQAATVQADRARRTAAELAVSTSIDLGLQAARRDFTLLEQGFQLANGTVVELRSELRATAEFINDNFLPLARGQAANFEQLTAGIIRANQDIILSTFANLDRQNEIAVKGLESFKRTAQDQANEVSATEVVPVQEKADAARNEAEARYSALLKTNVDFVQDARDQLEAAKKTQDETNILKAEGNLQESLGIQIAGEVYAEERRTAELKKAAALDQTAIEIQRRIDAKRDKDIAVQTRVVESERYRIVQQINLETGKLFQKNVQILGTIADLNKATGQAAPRTPFQAALGQINDVRTALTKQFAEAQAQATALIARLNDQIKATSLKISAGDRTQIPVLEREKQQLDNVIAEQRLTESYKEQKDAALDLAEAQAALQLSYNAIIPAVQATADGLIAALTQSFEGKKTNFLSLFKGIADNLFKDALQPAIESLKVAAQNVFKSAFKALAPNISNEMAGTLGPAFIAGFALIASFVLGQLLSGNNSSASAANPQVGIQSSEQVRGLIGGATQIPIGLVGESLQSALVPTNVLLARIANGVEGISFSGLNPQQIEATISHVVSDALQSQISRG